VNMSGRRSGIRWGRVAVGVIVAEIVPLALLILAVAAMSRGSIEADRVLANDLGAWIGPIGGFVMSFLAAWWAGRVTPGSAIKQGLIIGGLLAVIDLLLLLAMGEKPWDWLYAVSNAGKILAGVLGGTLASRGTSGGRSGFGADIEKARP
jgi:hypothetical protein